MELIRTVSTHVVSTGFYTTLDDNLAFIFYFLMQIVFKFNLMLAHLAFCFYCRSQYPGFFPSFPLALLDCAAQVGIVFRVFCGHHSTASKEAGKEDISEERPNEPGLCLYSSERERERERERKAISLK